MPKRKQTTPVTPPTPEAIVQAATNNPQLATDEFKLGDRVFKVIDLDYDSYIRFFAYLRPLINAVASGMAQRQGISIPSIELPESSLSATRLIDFCIADLPEMVRLICAQTVPDITVEEVKTNGKTPFVLAAIVVKQLVRNNVVAQFTSFFGQILPLMKMLGLKTQPSE
jgi:hypothetical protein